MRRRGHALSEGLSPQVENMVRDLLEIGIFGHTCDDVIERLLCDRLRQIAQEGWLTMGPSKP
jgi:hypothetical protein